MDGDRIVDQTKQWIERLVIAYQLCPFARLPYETGRIRYQVSFAFEPKRLLERLVEELVLLHRADPLDVETTLLIVPDWLEDFDLYLDLLAVAEELVLEMGLEGVLQVASFHPRYRFESTNDDDPANYTNRSPYPMFHLIREASIEQALKHFPQPEKIPARNVQVMREMGLEAVKSILDDVKGAR